MGVEPGQEGKRAGKANVGRVLQGAWEQGSVCKTRKLVLLFFCTHLPLNEATNPPSASCFQTVWAGKHPVTNRYTRKSRGDLSKALTSFATKSRDSSWRLGSQHPKLGYLTALHPGFLTCKMGNVIIPALLDYCKDEIDNVGRTHTQH